MSDDELPHLRIERTERETKRRPSNPPRPKPPTSLAAHAKALGEAVAAIQHSPPPLTGFDDRRILKLEVQTGDPADLEKQIPGLTVVSQEDKTLTVLFANRDGLELFRRRLEQLERTGTTKYQQTLWNITSVADWTADDRRGRVLRLEGIPEGPDLILDVELWPLDTVPARRAMVRKFGEWCRLNLVEILDSLEAESLIVSRIKAPRAGLDALLEHRDVRLVDLPPRFGFDFRLLSTSLRAVGPVPPPPASAPKIAVLDTGVVGAHPLVAPALREARSFVRDGQAEDENGHGTHVCGLALYGDVHACIEQGFEARLWLLSGRISDPGPENHADSELLENRIKRAVEYFVEHYGCRVFVMAFCDARRPYAGKHVDRFAAFIDELAATHRVLFVIPTGNFSGDTEEHRWKSGYPQYLLEDAARLLDPAPALNALTVGSLARYEQSRIAQRYPKDPRATPVARRDQPSPFSRRGPGLRGATKPEVVAYGGNYSVDRTGGGERLTNQRDLGELSLNHEFAGGNLFLLDAGTSQAAPQVGHAAARILERLPDASANLLRALVVAHAEVPRASQDLLGDDTPDLVGHGKPRLLQSMFSSERRVTMWAEAEISEDTSQFYEIPIPADFLKKPQRRSRRIVVVLSHMPRVRRTRFDYRSSRVEFRIVRGTSMDQIASIFRRPENPNGGKRKTTKTGRNAKPKLPDLPDEPRGVAPGISIRSKSTLQRATWLVKQTSISWHTKPPYLVVTSRPPVWGRTLEGHSERYALVVVVEDLSEAQVLLHSQARAILEQRVRLRNRS